MFLKKFKTPSENFEILIRILRFSASICGIDLLRENYRMNWITYTLFTSITGYYIFVFLTIYKKFEEDWTIILRATVTLGSAFQGVSKLFSFISDKAVIMELYKLLSGIYKEYEKKGDKYWIALEACLEKTKQGLISLTIFYSIGYFGTIMVPWVSYVISGKRFLVIEFQVPGLDINTDIGYFLTLIFQSVLIVCFSFGLYCGDLVALMYLLQVFMFSYIFAAKIEYINEMIVKPENSKKPNVTKALKDIVEWHQLYLSYTSKCNDLFYYIITVQVMTAFISTILSIYLIIAGGWPGAYTYVFVSFCCLYLYCILGTENEVAIEKFENDIYNIHWYNMTIPQQKIVLQVLCKTQSPNTIDIAGVMPLSVSTALQLTKAMYSITMIMIKVFLE
ncbi:odorant receptor 67d-like [Cochliomyia hominivorax]